MALALLLAFGTLFFYCAIRGEGGSEAMGVALTCLYLRYAAGARRPLLAGLFFSMATLTRTPLVFTGLFFVLETLCPGPGRWRSCGSSGGACGRWRARWGSLPRGPPARAAGAGYNLYCYGRVGEFGHAFLYNNRVNADIDRYGLFDLHYLTRNLEAAFLRCRGSRGGPCAWATTRTA